MTSATCKHTDVMMRASVNDSGSRNRVFRGIALGLTLGALGGCGSDPTARR